MAKSLPPLGWLRSFEAAARHLSFTAAAEELGLTQSAISQQIKSLETRLGAPLFMRRARGLALTDFEGRLLPDIEGPLHALAAAIEGTDTGPSETLLTIAASVSVAQWVISPRLPEFQTRFPNLRVRLFSAIWPDDFIATRADVSIKFGSARQTGGDGELLLPNRLLALKSPDVMGDLGDLPLIEAVGTSGGWRSWTKRVGPTQAPAVFTDTYGMALQLAVQGNGVALISELLAKHPLEAGLVERAHPATLESQEGYYLSYAKDKPQACAFRDWLLETLEAPASEQGPNAVDPAT